MPNISEVDGNDTVVVIADERSLRQAVRDLPDSRFGREEIAFDRDHQTLTLMLWTGPPVVNAPYRHIFGWLYQGTRYLRKSVLILHNVDRCEMSFAEPHDYYEIATIDFDAKRYTIKINTHYGFAADLHINELSGQLSSTAELKASGKSLFLSRAEPT